MATETAEVGHLGVASDAPVLLASQRVHGDERPPAALGLRAGGGHEQERARNHGGTFQTHTVVAGLQRRRAELVQLEAVGDITPSADLDHAGARGVREQASGPTGPVGGIEPEI